MCAAGPLSTAKHGQARLSTVKDGGLYHPVVEIMATIANMAVMLSANAQGLVSGLATAQKKLTNFAGFVGGALDKGLVQTTRELFGSLTKTITDGLSAIPFLGAPLAFVAGTLGGIVDGGFGLLTFLRKTWAGMKELGNQAKALGISVSDLSVLMFAAGSHGEEMNKALFRMTVTLGRARTGSKEAQAAFGRLGLDVEELASLPVAEQFYRTADAIASIRNPALQASAAFAVFGKGVGPILHLIKQGEEGLKKFKEQAQRRGFVFNEADVEAARQGAKALDELDKTFAGVKNAFAVAVTPIATVLVKSLNDLAKQVGGFPELFRSLADQAAQFLAQIADGVAAIILKIDELIDRVTKLFSFNPPPWLSKVIVLGSATLTPIFTSPAVNPTPQALGATSAQKAANFFGHLADQLRQLPTLFKNAQPPQGGEGLDDFVRLWDKAAKIWEDIQSPLDRFQNKLADLDELLQAGILSWEDYALATSKAFEELEKAQKLTSTTAPAAAVEGSREAYSAIVAFRQDRGQDAQQRIESVLKESRAIQERQARAAEETAHVLQNLTVVDF